MDLHGTEPPQPLKRNTTAACRAGCAAHAPLLTLGTRTGTRAWRARTTRSTTEKSTTSAPGGPALAHLRWCTTSLLPLPPGKTARAQHGVLVPPSTTPHSALRPSLFMYHLYNTKTIVPGQYTSSIPCQPTSQARPACGSSPLSLVSAAPWGLRGTQDRPSFGSSQPSPGSAGSCAAPGPVAG